MRHPNATLRSLCVALVMLALPASLLMLSGPLAPGLAQGPPDGGSPGNSDRRQMDPCEQAVRPRGQALGLQAQCDPVGGGGSARGDFNGDGIGDLAIGVPGEDITRSNGTVVRDAGAVHIVYGTAGGLSTAGNQLLHQDVPGVSGTPTTGDSFGWSVVAGHFNNDIYSDLAVGVPNEDIGGLNNVGAVQVFYGSAGGLRTDVQQLWHYQLVSGIQSVNSRSDYIPSAGDQWGWSLVWADFNGDGIGDLAIGIPNADVNFCLFPFVCELDPDAGAVMVLYGSSLGLGLLGGQSIPGGAQAFGLVLSAGDYNGDGVADLAIGVPLSASRIGGRVEVYFGSPSGFARSNTQSLFQTDTFGGDENEDRFGSALASGDFNGDGRDDLAVGVPLEDLVNNTLANAGLVLVYRGTATGLTPSQALSQSTVSADPLEAGDRFGAALAAGDFNGDGRSDLAIGVPGEDFSGLSNAGLVHVVYGASTGLTSAGAQIWHQDSSGIANSAEAGDQFGFALTAWNFGRGAQADLAVGIPFEDVGTIIDAGAVHVIYGSAVGLTADGDQHWTQNSLAGDGAEANDNFGRAVY